KPDGLICSNGQILKKTGANDWDCASDSTGGASSNSLDFDEFVNTMELDADLRINTPASRKIGIGAAPSTYFEVQGTASASYLLTTNTLQVGGPTSVAYSRFGTDTTTHLGTISGVNDLLISGGLEVNGSTAFDGTFNKFSGNVSISGGFEVGNGGYASASRYYGGGLVDCDSNGDQLEWTASGSNAGKFSCGTDRASYYKRKKVSESLASSIVLQNDDQLSFPVGQNEEWAVNFYVQGFADSNQDWLFAVAAPRSGPSVCSIGVIGNGTVSTLNTGDLDCGVSSGVVPNDEDLASESFEIFGTVITTTFSNTGSISLQWAQGVSNAAANKVAKGSYLLAFKISGADLAEIYYTKDADVKPGTIVSIDPDLSAGVKKSAGSYDPN
ncbi:MAG: hypothetical protein AAB592_00905, partial [Patescibacteria group bacterium]